MSNKSYKLNTTVIPNNDKKEDHNTGVSFGIKKFVMKNLIQNLKNGALSGNLIKSIKKYFIKNLIKILKNGALSKNLIKSIKKFFIKNLIKNLKKAPYHV